MGEKRHVPEVFLLKDLIISLFQASELSNHFGVCLTDCDTNVVLSYIPI